MLNKKIIAIALLFACLFAISTVNASDNATDIYEVSDDAVKINNEKMDEGLLSEDNEEMTSFSHLDYLITNEEAPKLTNNIKFSEKYDGNFTAGIQIIRNNTVIDGDNHIVDANGKARIFNVTGNNITLMNFKFINAFSDKGAAIYSTGEDMKIINCTFLNGVASTEAGAIFLRAPRGQIINSTFINSSSYYTGAVLINSVNASVCGSYFENNRANVSAGALGWAKKDNGIIRDCTFVNNSAYNEGGGALFWNGGKNGLIENTKFINNFANFNGSAIFWSFADDGRIINSLFENNSATVSGGAIFLKGNKNVIYNSTFINNTADSGQAIYTKNDLDILKSTIVNNDVYGENCVVNVISDPENTQIAAKTATFIINYDGKYSITLMDSKGNLIKAKTVTFNLAGKNIGSATTNSKGVASIKISAKTLKAVKSGKKNLIIRFSEDYYSTVNKNVKLIVSKEKTKLAAKSKTFKYKSKSKKFTVALKDSKNRGIKNTKVTINVNKKIYVANTNSKGHATFKLTKLTKKGKFTAVIKYAGSKYYVSKTLKVKITCR